MGSSYTGHEIEKKIGVPSEFVLAIQDYFDLQFSHLFGHLNIFWHFCNDQSNILVLIEETVHADGYPPSCTCTWVVVSESHCPTLLRGGEGGEERREGEE